MKKFFKEFEVELQIFDSDKCNGMSPVGDYSINSTWVIVAIGFWIAALIIGPLFVGEPMQILPVNILDMLGYIVFMPVSLFSTSWEAHTLMIEHKQKSLKRISDEIQGLLLKKNNSDFHDNLKQVEWLEKKHSIIETNMKTWPFRPIELRRLGLTSITPLFSILLPIISEKLFNKFFSP